jgi:hypothetical protein
MMINPFRKVFWMLALAMLLGAVSVAQTPPANQGPLPQLPKPHQLLLEVDLRLDSGAASTNNRALTLDFTALEKGDGNVTIQNDTAKITHYRALEDLGISGAPFNIAPHSTVEGELFGTTNSPGELHIRAKWHIAVLTPKVFDRLKVEILYDGNVLATDYGYSIHSNEANKLDIKLNSNGGDVFKWKLRITNDTGPQVNGFNIEKGDDANPFVPSFRSTFKPSCN